MHDFTQKHTSGCMRMIPCMHIASYYVDKYTTMKLYSLKEVYRALTQEYQERKNEKPSPFSDSSMKAQGQKSNY
jgi:hypothetical protein